MAREVALTINGRGITVSEGITVLEAAERAGIHIPHLCYCPGLTSPGACRLCLVQVEGVVRPVVSCRYPVKEGMRVNTDTEELRLLRRFVIELLLSRHPGDCLQCEKSGECLLQQYAYELGADRDAFPRRHPGYAVEKGNPFIIRDLNLCVLCERCVRACQERGAEILEFTRRGLETSVGTLFNKPLEEAGCDFCGSCVEVCPTGALVERQRQGGGRLWETQKKEGVCWHCGGGCSYRLSVKDGRLLRVRSASLSNYLCARGRFGWGYLYSPERLTFPLVKKNGVLVAASWDEALDAAANGLRGVLDQHGAGSVGGIVGAMVSSEVASLFTRLVREGLQGDYVDSILRFAGRRFLESFEALGGVFGYATMDDVAEADVLLVIGDIVDRVPALWPRIKKALKRGATLIALGFRESRVARAAHIWLRPRPGAEVGVLERLALFLLEKDWYDRENLDRAFPAGDGYEQIRGAIMRAHPEIGFSEEDVEAAAAAYGDLSRKSVILFPVDGVTSAVGQAVLRLAFLTGRLSRGIFPGAGIPNLRGLLQAGAYPANGDRLYAGETTLRALYVLAEDPINTFPQSAQAKALLAGLDFLVVQDMFLTETAALADVVFPASVPLEAGGTLRNLDGTVRECTPALSSSVLPESSVITKLMERLGMVGDGESGSAGLSSGQVAMQQKTILEIDSYRNKVLLKLRQDAILQETILATESMIVSQPNPEYPLLLVPYASPYRIYLAKRSQMAGLDVVGARGECLRVAPEDASVIGIGSEGGQVMVRTESAAVVVKAIPDATLPAGVVTLPAFSTEANTLLAPGQFVVPVAVTVEAETKGGNAL